MPRHRKSTQKHLEFYEPKGLDYFIASMFKTCSERKSLLKLDKSPQELAELVMNPHQQKIIKLDFLKMLSEATWAMDEAKVFFLVTFCATLLSFCGPHASLLLESFQKLMLEWGIDWSYVIVNEDTIEMAFPTTQSLLTQNISTFKQKFQDSVFQFISKWTGVTKGELEDLFEYSHDFTLGCLMERVTNALKKCPVVSRNQGERIHGDFVGIFLKDLITLSEDDCRRTYVDALGENLHTSSHGWWDRNVIIAHVANFLTFFYFATAIVYAVDPPHDPVTKVQQLVNKIEQIRRIPFVVGIDPDDHTVHFKANYRIMWTTKFEFTPDLQTNTLQFISNLYRVETSVVTAWMVSYLGAEFSNKLFQFMSGVLMEEVVLA